MFSLNRFQESVNINCGIFASIEDPKPNIICIAESHFFSVLIVFDRFDLDTIWMLHFNF